MTTDTKAGASPGPVDPPRPQGRRPRRAHLLLRGRVRPDEGRQGQHHDPRVHVRDGDLRGHPRLLERGAGQALRPEAARARRAHPPVVPDPAHGRHPVGRRAVGAHHRDRPAQRRSARTPTSGPSFYKSTRAIGVRLHDLDHELYIIAAAVRELHRHRQGRPAHDLVLAPQRRRGAAGPRQDRRRLREHGLPEVGGRAQRLRRGGRADRQRPRQRVVAPPTSTSSATASRSRRRSTTTCSRA